MKVLVTGAAGRLGSRTVQKLVESGHTVRATDVRYRKDLPVPVEMANLLDVMVCYKLLEGMEAVVHLGNHANWWGREAQCVFNENCAMNMNVFAAAAEMGIKKLVFSSSIQAQAGGRTFKDKNAASVLPYLPLDSHLPANAANPYALSKVVGEQILAVLAKYQGVSATAIRFPGLPEPEWVARYRNPHQHHGHDHGNPDEAFTYLMTTDAAALNEAVLRAELPGFRVYFPSAPDPMITRPVRDVIRDYFATVPLRKPMEEIKSLVDISAITAQTGWKPTIPAGWE